MRRIRATRAVGVTTLSAALLLGGVACSSDDKSEPVATTTTTAVAGNKSFGVMTDDGQVSLSLDGSLPPGWPREFPVPDGAEPAGSGSLGNSDTTRMIGVFTSSGEPSAAFDFYTQEADLKIESQLSLGVGSKYVGTVKFSGTRSGNVTVVPRDGKTLIIVNLAITGETTETTSGS